MAASPTYQVLLNGELTTLRPGWSHTQSANGQATFSAVCASRDGSWRPDLDDDLVVLEGVPILSSSVSGSTLITTAIDHGVVSGQTVEISGHTGSTPAINGPYVATRVSARTFTIPVAVTVAGAGGLASRRIMAGLLNALGEAGWEGQGLTPIEHRLEFGDYATIPGHRHVSLVLTGVSPAVPAYGFLSIPAICANGTTVTIGSRVYTFVTTLSDVAGYVLIASTISGCLSNLVAAILGGDGSGVVYAAATTAHPDVIAVSQANVLKVVARVAGTAGNGLAFAATCGSCYGEGTVPLAALARGAASSGTASTAGAAIATIAALLADDGVTVHPDQEDLAELPELTYSYKLVQEILDELSGLCGGAIWTIDSYRRLRLRLPTSDPAPISVTVENQVAIGDIGVERTRASGYANRVIVRYSEQAQRAYGFLGVVANFPDAATVTIGSQTYTFEATLTDVSGHVLLGASIVESLGHLVAAITGGDGSGTVYAAKTTVHAAVTAGLWSSSILVVQALTAGAAGNSVGVATDWADAVWYGEGSVPLSSLARGSDTQLINTVEVNDVAEQRRRRGIWDQVIEAADVVAVEQATLIAETALAASILSPRTVVYFTKALGLCPGQSQTIMAPTRNLNGTFLITDVETIRTTGSWVLRKVTAIESLILQSVERWQETYKRAFSGGGTATSTGTFFVGGSGGGGSSSRPPLLFFGGSDTVWQQAGAGAWTAATSVQIQVDTAARGSATGTCFVRLRVQAGTVTARLRDLTHGTTCGTSVAVSATDFETVSFPVVLTSGVAVYTIELSPSLSNTDVQCGCAYVDA